MDILCNLYIQEYLSKRNNFALLRLRSATKKSRLLSEAEAIRVAIKQQRNK